MSAAVRLHRCCDAGVFFRLSFTASPEDIKEPVTAGISYDDAAVVYLNGRQILSCNAPEGGYERPYEYGCGDICDDPAVSALTIEPEQLREGRNVLAVELHQAHDESSDIFFSLGGFTYCTAEEFDTNSVRYDPLRGDTVCLCVGGSDSEALVSWRGPVCGGAFVEVCAADDADFSNAYIYPAQSFYTDDGACTYRAELTGLEAGGYLYRVSDVGVSDVFAFDVPETGGGFSFLCCGDPQILDDDDDGALETFQSLAESVMGDENPAFILSLGDQADDGNDLDLYRFFTSMPILKSVPLAAVVGNHERKYEEFSRSFCMPNMDESTEYRAGDMSGDYWFFHGNTLFLCLNSNNPDVEAHARFMERARRECEESFGEPTWTAAALHFSYFSAGKHADDDDITENRKALAEAFKAAGVDAVFSGHDHSYTRSYPMDGEKPLGEGESGIVYFAFGSSTGSKMNELGDGEREYAAFAADGEYPAMTRVDVTEDVFTVTTYRYKNGAPEILDSYNIEKSSRQD